MGFTVAPVGRSRQGRVNRLRIGWFESASAQGPPLLGWYLPWGIQGQGIGARGIGATQVKEGVGFGLRMGWFAYEGCSPRRALTNLQELAILREAVPPGSASPQMRRIKNREDKKHD